MRVRALIGVGATAAVAWTLLAGTPLGAGQTGHSYAQERRVIRAAILNPGYGFDPSPYVFFLLGAESVSVPLGAQTYDFYPPRPPGWEIINPIAIPGVARSAPDYWRLNIGPIDAPLLENFDLLLLPVRSEIGAPLNLSLHQQRVLERWVNRGGLLWIDNQPGPNPGEDPQLGDFFLRPRVEFAARDRNASAPKVSVDLTHPLLRARCPLTENEVQWLGQQYAYGAVGDPTNAGLSPLDGIVNGVNNPFPPNSALADYTALQEVVGAIYDDPGSGERRRAPVVAAGYYGDGCIVVTACGVAAGINNWFQDLSGGAAQTATELPQWALPDLKFAYNMIQWWMDWAGTRGRVRFRGEYGEQVAGPPLLTWTDIGAGALGGPAAVDRGLVFAGSSAGLLAAWDSEPQRDRDLDGGSDEGETDYGAGAAADVLWSVIVPWQDLADQAVVPAPPPRVEGALDPLYPTYEELPRQVVGSPAVATAYDGTGPRRLVAVAVRTNDDQDCSLHAYYADALDASSIVTDPDYPEVAPAWSATIKRYDKPQPGDNYGLVSSGPVAVDEFFALLTTDSGTLEAPNRDARLLIYDAAGPTSVFNTYYEEPAAQVQMTEGGRAASFANPPAVAMTTAWDEVMRLWQPVQALVSVGNALPRPGPAASARMWVTPLQVRFPAPGWDRSWLLNPAEADIAANQAVQVVIRDQPVPPHVDDNPTQPLNYIRTTVGGQIRIIFCRWSLFGQGQFPLGFDDVVVRYRDTAGTQREVRQKLHPGTPVALGGYVSEAGLASPCVVENDVYVGTDAVSAYPNPSIEGQVGCYSMGLDRASGPEWTFVGERYRGTPAAASTGYYFSSFSFTPAYSEHTLFVAGNYEFFHSEEDQSNEALSPGPAGALYALELRASPELVRPGTADPVFTSPIDPVAPRNDGVNPPPYSADPNQTVPAGRSGAAVWISTSLADDSPRYAIPQMAGTTPNWTVDFRNSIIRLGAGVFGRLGCPVWSDMGTPGDPSDDRYVPQVLRVRYFSGGSLVETTMEVTPLVKWMYLAPDGLQFVSPPVVTNDMVFVIAYEHDAQRYLLLGFRAVPEDPTPDDPTDRLWARPAEPQFVTVLATGVPTPHPCNLAVSERGLVWSGGLVGEEPYTDLNDNGQYDAGEPYVDLNNNDEHDPAVSLALVGRLSGAETVIADNDRLVATDPGGRVSATQEAVATPNASGKIGIMGIPAGDSYAERAFEPLERARRVRALPNGNLLVVDSGAGCVLEIGPAGDVVWRYPSGETADLGGLNEEQARLVAPSDAQRYYYREVVSGTDLVDPLGLIEPTDSVVVDWASTLIADAGNCRVLEVVRPLLDGRYRPEVSDAATGMRYAELVRVLAAPDKTTWPTALGGTTRLQAAFTTAARFGGVDGTTPQADANFPFLSGNIMCAVANAPEVRQARLVGEDRYVSLVEIAITYDNAGRVATSEVVARPGDEGINVFRPRTAPWTTAENEQLPRDFLNIRQADPVVTQDPATGNPIYQTLIVDDVGVKVIDNATWNVDLTPTFEMRGTAPWLHDAGIERAGDFLTTYEEEIAGGDYGATEILGLGRALENWVAEFGDPTTTGNYPPLIQEPRTGFSEGQWEALRAAAWNNLVAYAQAVANAGASGQVPFLPAYAVQLRNGKYLIVNSYANPYLSEGPLDVMAPVTSEVFEVDPSQPVGQRIVDSWDEELDAWHTHAWEHFMVPDPARSEYPSLRGGAGPLRQPWAADRR